MINVTHGKIGLRRMTWTRTWKGRMTQGEGYLGREQWSMHVGERGGKRSGHAWLGPGEWVGGARGRSGSGTEWLAAYVCESSSITRERSSETPPN